MNPVNHVAIIMDGNGRWGIINKNSRNLGHRAGLETLQTIINETIKLKINYLTLYTFSTENWKRPKNEIDYLFKLLENFLKKKINLLKDKDIKLKIIGDKRIFSKSLKDQLNKSELATFKNKRLHINLAINYGSKNEIVRAVKIIKKKKQIINEKNINKNLFTQNLPAPDLLIRTGNTKRISNFLLWQIAYTEIFFEKKLWPDFKAIDYRRIINTFKKIKRNFGNI
jgi:undecaprenyl diphosphate synthase